MFFIGLSAAHIKKSILYLSKILKSFVELKYLFIHSTQILLSIFFIYSLVECTLYSPILDFVYINCLLKLLIFTLSPSIKIYFFMPQANKCCNAILPIPPIPKIHTTESSNFFWSLLGYLLKVEKYSTWFSTIVSIYIFL